MTEQIKKYNGRASVIKVFCLNYIPRPLFFITIIEIFNLFIFKTNSEIKAPAQVLFKFIIELPHDLID